MPCQPMRLDLAQDWCMTYSFRTMGIVRRQQRIVLLLKGVLPCGGWLIGLEITTLQDMEKEIFHVYW